MVSNAPTKASSSSSDSDDSGSGNWQEGDLEMSLYNMHHVQNSNRRQQSSTYQVGAVQISGQRIRPPQRLSQDPDSVIEDLIAGNDPVYESDPIPVPDANSNDLLIYPFPAGVVANAIVVTLIGKNHEQFQGSGYYVCLERVDCRGIPLYPQPSVEL